MMGDAWLLVLKDSRTHDCLGKHLKAADVSESSGSNGQEQSAYSSNFDQCDFSLVKLDCT